MGRPLKISKYSPGSGDTTVNGVAVVVDNGFPPFAAPTSMDLPTVVLPQPATSPLPYTGVTGGAPVLSSPSANNPVVLVQVNIALPDGTGAGSHAGRIIRQKGAHKFLVVDSTNLQDEQVVVGAAYMILSAGGTDWTQWGAPIGWQVGTIFTCTSTGTLANGTALLVGQCVLKNQASPTVGNMAITMSVGDSTGTRISKLTNKFAQDFTGGETGGNANTGDVWAESAVQGNLEYAANFFVDGEKFAKSGADVATWGTNGSAQNNDGTLLMAEVAKVTS